MTVGLENVSFSYGDKEICRDVSLTIPERGCVCLWGPSGCGKTTVLRLLCGLERPASGRVIGNAAFSVVFQEDRLLPFHTVRRNITLPGCSDAVAAEWIARLELGEWADALPDSLSGGQSRRVALARALANPADVLILDEPFNGLDERLRDKTADAVRKQAERCPVVLVTHNPEDIARLDARRITLPPKPLTGRLIPENF